ncbi:MAG: cupin domain-containing protein [Planctomycetes bacterium]|nr:cupin domain-containing protein [Planctomycetota bacterium]
MGKYDTVELSGTEKAGVVAKCLARIREWGLTMPDVEPLALHFGLGRFEEVGEIEFWIANETDEGYCGKFLFVFDGQTCPYHHHAKKHETFYIVKGKVRMRIGDDEREMAEGDHLAMPPNTGHSFTGIGDALLLEVSSPSVLLDNFFEDKNIGDNGVI